MRLTKLALGMLAIGVWVGPTERKQSAVRVKPLKEWLLR